MPKGRDAEQVVMAAYERAGYRCYSPPPAKYREQDVFGLFDILAFGGSRLEGVQVKGGETARGINEWFRETKVFDARLPGFTATFIHVGDDGWRVARRQDGTWQWVLDCRDSDRYSSDELVDLVAA